MHDAVLIHLEQLHNGMPYTKSITSPPSWRLHAPKISYAHYIPFTIWEQVKQAAGIYAIECHGHFHPLDDLFVRNGRENRMIRQDYTHIIQRYIIYMQTSVLTTCRIPTKSTPRPRGESAISWVASMMALTMIHTVAYKYDATTTNWHDIPWRKYKK